MLKKGLKGLPNLLFADQRGVILEHPYLKMVGFNGRDFVPVPLEELIVLPPLSKLFYLPGIRPVGIDPETGRIEVLDQIWIGGKKVVPNAISAFLSPGYVRTHLPAGLPEKVRPTLPLWAYTAVGGRGGHFYAAAFLVEKNYKWDPLNYDDRKILPQVNRMRKIFPRNRLLEHLINCALTNHCFAAKNLLLTRWEAPVPTSRACNARCLGCLSDQEEAELKSHDRISFRPTVGEIVSLCYWHLEHAPEPIVSFGQGCEGEPLTEHHLIEESISAIRERTKKGIINLNTNGSWPERVELLCRAGLNSIRVSLISPRKAIFMAYHRPHNYSLSEVVESIKIAKGFGLFTMINYLVFPGITDQMDELEALTSLIEETQVDFIHLKNLCIDPWLYLDSVPVGNSSVLGLKVFHETLRERFPYVNFGYFNQVPHRLQSLA